MCVSPVVQLRHHLALQDARDDTLRHQPVAAVVDDRRPQCVNPRHVDLVIRPVNNPVASVPPFEWRRRQVLPPGGL